MLWLCVCILALVTQHIQHVYSTQHYIVICGVSWLYHIFPHYRINGTISGKRHPESAFWFSLQHSCEKNFILRRIGSHIINVHRSSCKVPVTVVRFWWNRWIFGTFTNMKFHENSSRGIRVIPCGQTEWRRQTQRRLPSFFRNFANPPKNCLKFVYGYFRYLFWDFSTFWPLRGLYAFQCLLFFLYMWLFKCRY